MDNNKKMGKFDIDIEIKDLLWEFIRKWRVIVVLAVVCGIALAAFQYRSDMNKTDVVTVKKTQEELEHAMGTQDLDEVTAAVALKRQADELSAYMESSLLMKLNPYEENVMFLQYYVSADSEAVANDANDAYITYITQGSLETELVSIVKETDAVYYNAKSVSDRAALKVEGNSKERVLSVKVIGVTAEEAAKLANEVKIAFEEYSSVVSANIGVHQLQLMNEISAVIVDQNLAELQNWNATSIKTISNNLDSMKNEMTSDQISLFVYRTTVLEEDVTTGMVGSVSEPAKISVKHFVIGVVIGVVLACALIFALYLFAPALRNEAEVKTLYGVKILGCVNDADFQKKKLFGCIDKWIVKLQNGRKKALTFEQEVQMICANIALDCKKSGKNEVFLTSSAAEAIPETVQKNIVAKCEEKGIRVISGAAISYDAEALETLAGIGNVVFIEKKRVSLYDEIYSEVALCKEHEINVLGMVVLGV